MSTIERNNEEGSKSNTEEGSNSNSIGGAIFVLNNLMFDFNEEDDFPVTVPELPNRLGKIAAVYHIVSVNGVMILIEALSNILPSGLNAAGFVRAIYLHFGPEAEGYYEFNPNTMLYTAAAFEGQLCDLFRIGKVSSLSSIMSTLPANCRKIGCLYGPNSSSQGSTNIIENIRYYLTDVSSEQTFLFVVGQIDTQVRAYIDDFVKVTDYDVNVETCLGRIVIALERKLNII